MLSEETASDLRIMEIVLYDAYDDMAMSGALPDELRETGDAWQRLYAWNRASDLYAWKCANNIPLDDELNEMPLDEVLIKTTLRRFARAYLGLGGAGSS